MPAGKEKSLRTISITEDFCNGCATCCFTAPDVFEAVGCRAVRVKTVRVRGKELKLVRKAAKECFGGAIEISDD